ncbi:hypothetical protein OAQ99_01855 [Candidatus Kapabacteria bacterium]|nr:hypothetical protein [Candidatus Kapabacteria bacterium]
MKKILYIVLLFTLFILLTSEKDKKDLQVVNKFDISVKFPVNIKHSYRMDEITNVERTYDDGSKYSYKRTSTYFITLWSPERPENGFQNVFTQIDSLEYNFDDGVKNVSYYNSQDEMPPLNVQDFSKTLIPNALEFYMKYDSYGVVSKIDGGNRTEKLNYINHPEYGFQDKESYDYKRFMNRYSEQDIKHIADPTKGVLPPFAVAKDSTWAIDFKFDVNFASFSGVCKPKFNMLLDNHYYIDMSIDSIDFSDDYYDLHDQKILATIDSSDVEGNFEMKISSKGHVKYIQTDSKVWLEGKAKNRRFREEIQSMQKWDLIGMWHL